MWKANCIDYCNNSQIFLCLCFFELQSYTKALVHFQYKGFGLRLIKLLFRPEARNHRFGDLPEEFSSFFELLSDPVPMPNHYMNAALWLVEIFMHDVILRKVFRRSNQNLWPILYLARIINWVRWRFPVVFILPMTSSSNDLAWKFFPSLRSSDFRAKFQLLKPYVNAVWIFGEFYYYYCAFRARRISEAPGGIALERNTDLLGPQDSTRRVTSG